MDKRVERVGARVLLLAAAGFCGNISWQLVLPVLPLHLARLGYTTAQIGFLISILSLVMGTVELQAGFVARAVGRRAALVTGFSANAICLVLASAARSAGAVASTLGAIGGARAVFVPPLQAAVAESSTASTRGRVLSVYWFWASAATLVGPAVGGFIAARHGDRAPFYLASAMSLLALPAVAAATAPRRAAPAGTSHDLRSVLANRTVVRLSAACMLCFGISGLWSTFLPLQMAHHGISVAVVGWVFAVQGCLYTLMQIATGRMIAHRRAAWVAPAGIVGMSAAAVLVPLLRSPAGFLALGACYGASFGVIPVMFATRVTWRTARESYTTAMGVYNSAIDYGLFLGPLLGGALALVSPVPPFGLALPLGLAALILSRESTDTGRGVDAKA
ncbi:MAG TPA: MFS transporter [bacterium]|nr:MFS transporter [bacterium]